MPYDGRLEKDGLYVIKLYVITVFISQTVYRILRMCSVNIVFKIPVQDQLGKPAIVYLIQYSCIGPCAKQPPKITNIYW